MPTNTLTDAKCRAAKAKDKAYKLFDGGGLHLWVSTTGARVWRLAYRLHGRPQQMSFGDYPEVSLADAREKRDQVKAQLRAGEDPMAARRSTRAGMTLKEANEAYWEGRGDLSSSYRELARRAIEMHLVPKLGIRNVAGITRQDLLAELLKMDAAGLHDYVRKVRMWVGQVFDWAVENGNAPLNPAALIDPRKAFGRSKVEHFAALEQGEIPELLQRLALEGELQSVLACRMLALTWTRTTELRLMEWTEIEGDLWRIPAGRMKRRRDHLVPLSRQALQLLEKLKARSRGSAYVFPADHTALRPMSDNAILYLLYRMGYQGRMTGHGWRTVASTWANENGFEPDVIERQLAHAPDDRTRATYNRAEYLPQRRKLLQAWADWLESQADAGGAKG